MKLAISDPIMKEEEIKDEGKELRERYKSTRNIKNTRVNYVSSSGPPLQLSSTCPVYFRFPPPWVRHLSGPPSS